MLAGHRDPGPIGASLAPPRGLGTRDCPPQAARRTGVAGRLAQRQQSLGADAPVAWRAPWPRSGQPPRRPAGIAADVAVAVARVARRRGTRSCGWCRTAPPRRGSCPAHDTRSGCSTRPSQSSQWRSLGWCRWSAQHRHSAARGSPRSVRSAEGWGLLGGHGWGLSHGHGQRRNQAGWGVGLRRAAVESVRPGPLSGPLWILSHVSHVSHGCTACTRLRHMRRFTGNPVCGTTSQPQHLVLRARATPRMSWFSPDRMCPGVLMKALIA